MSLPSRFAVARALGLPALAALCLLLAPAAEWAGAQAQTQPQLQTQPPSELPGESGKADTTPAEPVQRFDDWILRCIKPAEQPTAKICHLGQTISYRDSGQPVLQFAVQLIAEEKAGVLITLPLGIRLPRGITITIDGKDPFKLQAERCLPHGCQFELLLDEALEARFKAGMKGEVSVYDLRNREIVLPFSLKGFTAGFKALPAAAR